MYEKAGNKTGIADLLISNARKNPSSGHYYEMRKYYLSLPKENIENSVELMSAMSMLQSMLMNETESEYWYDKLVEYAKNATGVLKKEAQNRIVYLDIGLPHRGISGLADIIKYAGTLLLNRKIRLPEFAVTSNLPSQMNGGKDFCEWSKKDREYVRLLGKPLGIVLGSYGKAVASLGLAESFLEKGADNYEVEALAVRGRMEAEICGRVEQCFVGIGIMTWLSVLTNHSDNAFMILDGFYEMIKDGKAPVMLVQNYETLRCRVNLYNARVAEVAKWMLDAPDENEEFCGMERFRYITKVRVYIADRQYEKAGILLDKLEYYAERMKRTYIAMEVKILRAIIWYRIGKKDWEKLLQEAVTETEKYNFVRLLTREGTAISPMLKKAKINWSNKTFKKQVEEECANMAILYPSYLNTFAPKESLDFSENAIKILRLQAAGKNTEQIAGELNISQATVKYHNKETYRKLDVKTRAQAIAEARNRKLI